MRGCSGGLLCLALLSLFNIGNASAQSPQYAFRIYLKDKTGAPPVSAAASFLSTRSLARRNTQNIAVDNTDRPVSPLYISDILTATDGKFHVTSRWFNTVVILLEDSAKILQLQPKSYIDSIKYIAYYASTLHYRTSNNETPPQTSEQNYKPQMKITGTAAYYGDTYAQTQMVNGDYLHDRDYKGEGKLIAVLDNGFAGVDTNPGFDSLNQNARLADKFNFVRFNNDVFSGSYNHGTASLSTMAANMPGIYVGAAPNASYVLYVTEDDRSEMEIELDNLVAGTERADSIGADIVSVSLGYNTFQFPFSANSLVFAQLDGKTTIPARAANMATAKGMLFAASAGNEGGGAWNNILTPGDADSAITVGSVDPSRNIAPNSGFGPNAAGRVKPDVCMVGHPAMVLTTGPHPVGINGTSFAVPQLAGWAACLWQTKPTATPYMIRNAIVQSADRYATPSNQEGYGVPNFKLALQFLDVKDTPTIPTPANWVTVSPNPFENDIELKIYHAKTGDILISVTDVSGKVVSTEKYNRLAGIQHIPFSRANSLIPGIYYLTVISSGNTIAIPIVKR